MRSNLEKSYISPRNIKPLDLSAVAFDAGVLESLKKGGFNVTEDQAVKMMEAFGMDAMTQGLTPASIVTPVQFLQTWLPGVVNIMTRARKIDELVGITTQGDWDDEEIVQMVMEQTGEVQPYSDYGSVPLSSWNNQFERRSIVRFEMGFTVGRLEEARSAKIRMNSADNKRGAAALGLEIERNAIGFYGYNGGNNRTYGFLTDPNLPNYVTVATGATTASPLWSVKNFVEIIADIRTAVQAIRTNTGDFIDPNDVDLTLAVPTALIDIAMSQVNTLNSVSVREWLRQTYPRMRVVSAPELNTANAGANVFYLYAESVQDGSTDDGRTFAQVVPAKFMTLGVEQRSKSYVEDFTNATAGILCKRPYAVVRYTGI